MSNRKKAAAPGGGRGGSGDFKTASENPDYINPTTSPQRKPKLPNGCTRRAFRQAAIRIQGQWAEKTPDRRTFATAAAAISLMLAARHVYDGAQVSVSKSRAPLARWSLRFREIAVVARMDANEQTERRLDALLHGWPES